MEQHTIHVTGERNIRFKGELIAEDREKTSTGRFLDLKLYKTSGNNYVCVSKKITQWQGETDSTQAVLVKTKDEIMGFFGMSDLAKNIYFEANIDCSVDVE